MDHEAGIDAYMDDALAPEDYPGEQIEAEHLVAEERESARQSWGIVDKGGAAWAVSKIEAARRDIAQAEEAAHARIGAAFMYVDRVKAQHSPTIEFFEQKLREFYEAHPPVKGKTITLATGSISKSTGGVKAEVVDADELVSWLAHHVPELLREKDPEPDLVRVKALFGEKISKEAGEFPAVVGPDFARQAADALCFELVAADDGGLVWVLDEESVRSVPPVGEVVPGVRFVRSDESFTVKGK